MTLRRVALISFAAIFLLGMLAFQYWVFPATVSGWFILVVLGLPAWFFLEWLGEKVLGGRFFSKLSSPARIALAVPVFAALCSLAALLVGVVRHLTTSM